MSFLLLRNSSLEDFLDDTTWFERFARQQGIDDSDLYGAISRAAEGSIGADLGGVVIKQRIARRNEGRSRGFRSISLFRRGDRAFFVDGFAKGNRGNLRPGELEVYRGFADEVFGYDEADLDRAVELTKLKELKDHGKDAPK